MFNNSEIILLIIIGLFILYIIFGNNGKITDNFKNVQPEFGKKEREIQYEEPLIVPQRYKPNIDEIINDVISWNNSCDSSNSEQNLERPLLNKNFLNIQFHNDYRDVLTGINNIIPERRQRFNMANIPIVYSEPPTCEVSKLINDFIEILNINIETQVQNHRNPNSGWDEAIPDPTIESGWDRQQKLLGLPPSLYDKPAEKSKLKLVGISFLRKYETDDEIRFIVDFVIKKLNVDDQMVLKAYFVQDKRPLVDENNFFVNSSVQMQILIEDIYITGYLSNEGNDSNLEFDNTKELFYDYDNMEYNNVTDPKYIQKVLLEKYKERAVAMDHRNSLLDEEGQDFQRTLPSIYDFSNIKATRTIFDDMNTPKIFY